jgi:hypothetical protein
VVVTVVQVPSFNFSHIRVAPLIEVVMVRDALLPHKNILGSFFPVSVQIETKSLKVGSSTGLETVIFSANVTFFVWEKLSLQEKIIAAKKTICKSKKRFLNR